MVHILLVEDNASLIDGLAYTLEKNGFSLDIARTVKDAKARLSSRAYDLLLLDVSLPDGTGFELCEQVRGAGSDIAILFLTAADEEWSIIRGLDSGGDDYMTKPFKIGELCSRIHALLRRTSGRKTQDLAVLHAGDTTIDLLSGRVTVGERTLELTAAEYRLICLLVRNANLVVTRNRIFSELWDGGGHFVDDNTLSVYIRRLREKVEEDPSHPRRLVTVRGFGYRWNEVQK